MPALPATDPRVMEVIQELRQDVRTLTAMVERLSLDMEHGRKRAEQEHEILALRLENLLLRFEERLRSPNGTESIHLRP